MRMLLTIFFSCLLPAVDAQRVMPVKADALMARIHDNSDTVYIVNFWATWCGPCVKELPAFEELSSKFKAQPLKIILVSVDFRSLLEKRVAPFVARKKMKCEVLLLDEKDQQSYIDKVDPSWSGAIPATIFIKGDKKKFAEQEFTYPDLLKQYQNFIQP